MRVATPVLAVLVAAWSWNPHQARAPFFDAVPVGEALERLGVPQLVCGVITAARSASGEFGSIFRFSDPERDAHILVSVPRRDRSHFGRLVELQLVSRLICLNTAVFPAPGGPVIELSDPGRIRFVSAPPSPEEAFFDDVERGIETTLPVPIEPRNPIYTPRARAALLQGESELLVRIDALGNVTAARIVQPLDPLLGLDDEALSTAMLWKFRPAQRNGAAVPSVATVVMGFDLGVGRAPRTSLIVQRAGQEATAVVQTPLPAEDPFVAGAATTVETLPSAWWMAVPPYSFDGLKAGIEGTVGLDVVVGLDGRVTRARVGESLAGGAHGLDDAALAAVRQWRFTPAATGGGPTAAAVRVSLTFGLRMPGGPR